MAQELVASLTAQLLHRQLGYGSLEGTSIFSTNNTTDVNANPENLFASALEHHNAFVSNNNHSNSNNSNNNNNIQVSPGGGSGGRDAYEFVAFLLWYLFLVLCCVIPTCCAYRRRRLVEARIAQQQASVTRIERQNLFILSSLRQSQRNSDQIREQRGEKIAEKLKETTMTVEQHHLVKISGDNVNDTACSPCVVKVLDEQAQQLQPKQSEDDNGNSDTKDNSPSTSPTTPPTNNTIAVDYDVEAADAETTNALRIPTNVPLPSSSNDGSADSLEAAPAPAQPLETTTRIVPGACAICLCPYEQGDKVTWSPRCPHVFHSSCIIPWLAKSDEPRCPCCRQEYCEPIPISQLNIELDPMSLFGTAGFAGLGERHHSDDDDAAGALVIPHFMRTLEASRLEFLATLEVAAVDASRSRGSDTNTNDSGSTHLSTTTATATSIHSGMMGGSPFVTVAENAQQQTGDVNQTSSASFVGTSAVEIQNGSFEAVTQEPTAVGSSTNTEV